MFIKLVDRYLFPFFHKALKAQLAKTLAAEARRRSAGSKKAASPNAARSGSSTDDKAALPYSVEAAIGEDGEFCEYSFYSVRSSCESYIA